jgi:hypothetical protein
VYDNLSQEERSDFFSTLLNELSKAVPVQFSRLNTVKNTQLDNNLSENRYLISIDVMETRNLYDNSAEAIIEHDNSMIKYKNQTLIGLGKVIRYLDESYSFIH